MSDFHVSALRERLCVLTLREMKVSSSPLYEPAFVVDLEKRNSAGDGGGGTPPSAKGQLSGGRGRGHGRGKGGGKGRAQPGAPAADGGDPGGDPLPKKQKTGDAARLSGGTGNGGVSPMDSVTEGEATDNEAAT